MELTQVKQLKLNVSNINSFLKNSNKNYNAIKKSNQRIVSQQVKQDKLKSKEKSIEKKPTISSPLKTVKDVAKSSMGLFDKILNFGGLLLTGILLNALPSIKEKIDKFKEDNKEIIDNVVSTLTVVKDFAVDLFDSFTGPYAEEGSLDFLGKFDDSGVLQSGVLKEIEKAFDLLGGMINGIDKALGGEGKIGNALITGQRVLAKKGGKTGVLNQTTGEFTEREFTQKEQERFEQNKPGSRPDTTVVPSVVQNQELDNVDGVDGSGLVVTSKMGMRGLALSPGMHMGVDIAGPVGTPLVAFTSGKLEDKGYDGGYGNYVVWTDDKGIEHFYGHLKEPSTVEIGSPLSKGQVIGLMGNTGRSSGPHLHWETATKVGDTGRSKAAVLSRFNPLSKYGKLDPFKIKKKTESSGDGKGGNMARLSRLSNNNRLASLNSSMGEDGSITYIYAVQPVIT